MNIKKTVSVAAAAAALAFTAIPANAFLGFGGSNIAKETTQIASWIAQYAQMVQQYNQLVEEYRSLNGHSYLDPWHQRILKRLRIPRL